MFFPPRSFRRQARPFPATHETHALNTWCPCGSRDDREGYARIYRGDCNTKTQWENKGDKVGVVTKKFSRTSDSVRSIRSLLSSVRFSEEAFSWPSPSPSCLKTLISSSVPRSSPPPLLLTCGIIAGTRATATVFPVLARSPYTNRLGSVRDVCPSAAIKIATERLDLPKLRPVRRRRVVIILTADGAIRLHFSSTDRDRVSPFTSVSHWPRTNETNFMTTQDNFTQREPSLSPPCFAGLVTDAWDDEVRPHYFAREKQSEMRNALRLLVYY